MKFLFLHALALCCVIAISGCNQATRLAQNVVTINASWSDNAVDHRGSNGVRYTYVCPPNPSQNGIGAAWGTGIYSDDSAVCPAAVHAGELTFAGGSVTIEIRGGRDSYNGSTRNG